MTWFQILTVGGLAGVISALVGAGIKELFEWRERIRKARYLALRLSLVLENYYHACVKQVSDIGDYRNSGGSVGSYVLSLSEIPEYPADPVAWVYLDPTIADEVLSLPADVRAINEGISFAIEIEGDPDGPDPDRTLKSLHEMAFKSISLARRVRSSHGLAETNRTKDSEARLREVQARFQKELQQREEEYRKWVIDLPSAPTPSPHQHP